jgi:2-keto-4-pentenoate hydratase/2-oxohepta-3-ene-1,7-dioic acid hydratase in catechol pathway
MATWCRFHANGRDSFGTIEGETIIEIEGTPWGDHSVSSRRHPVKSVKLLAPLVPGTFYCAGVNYRSHVIKMAAKRNAEPKFPEAADIGYRSPNAIIASGEAIVKPKDAGDEFQYEAELVAIIGKKGKHISKEKALEHVFGWTIGNDVSERAWQRNDRTMWRGKDTDTFKPMGPWIVTGLDYRKMRTVVKLDGKVVEDFATGDMIFSVEDFIERMTKYVTLYPGDVIWMGTDGVPENMRPGQTCEIEITGVGKLINPIVLDK